MHQSDVKNNAPWWKFGHVWLVISGPLIVVIAGCITLYLAITSPDPIVSEDYYRNGIEINKTLDSRTEGANLAPAMQARNHAQTGVVPTLKSPQKP